MPITSPVDFISGPRITSVPGNLANGKTASLTDICCILGLLSLKSDNFLPVIIKEAILTRGIPIDLATNGIVLLPLGFTSKTKIFSS